MSIKQLGEATLAVLIMEFCSIPAYAQLYEEIPGRREFTGEMVIRPLQVEDWMKRGLTRQQAEERYEQVSRWLVDFLDHRLIKYSPFYDRYDVRLDGNENENNFGAYLIARDEFRYVCPNWRNYPLSNNCPNDEDFGEQDHHLRIESCAAWQIHTAGDDDIVVALCEWGVKKNHEDLVDYRQLAYSAEEGKWEDEDPPPTLSNGDHGTPAHGIAAATGNNSDGVTGVGWSLRHRLVEAYENSEIVDGMEVVAAVGDRVLVSTVGPHGDQQTMDFWYESTKALYQEFDVLIFMSAGNNREDEDMEFPYMVVVGGTNTASDEIWYANPGHGSAFGGFIDIMTPCTSIYTTCHDANDCYGNEGSGTSWAAPMAAGLAALIWSYDKTLTADEVRDFIEIGCDEFVDYDPDEHGHGRLQRRGTSRGHCRSRRLVGDDGLSPMR